MADSDTTASPDAAVNRALWTQINARYSDDHAYRAWTAEHITWGSFNMPEQQLGVLGDVHGLKVAELGCGTAYFSAWLARRGARPVGVDITAAQLRSARRCQDLTGIRFPLVEADAARVPRRPGSFDLAISECGASLWCDPACWVPEAARLLRPGGRLIFHTTSTLLALCLPRNPGPARATLQRPQRDIYRMQSPLGGVKYHPSHSEWITILHKAGFIIDALHELHAPPGTTEHPFYQLATAEWAHNWPVEDLWAAQLAPD